MYQRTSSIDQNQNKDLAKQLLELEASIISEVAGLQKFRKRTDCFYYENEGECYNEKNSYYAQFWKTFIINQFMVNQLKELTENVTSFDSQIKKLEKLQEQYVELYKQKNKKKNRRLATEISKQFNCPYQNCYKVYGTDVSLNLHMKIKHNGGNKTERQALARQYVRATKLGHHLPPVNISFPPNYLDSFVQEYQRTRPQSF